VVVRDADEERVEAEDIQRLGARRSLSRDHEGSEAACGARPSPGVLRRVSEEAQDVIVEIPETRYARTVDGVHIAYQIVGDGPIDFVYVGPWATHIEYRWELPRYASYLRRLASFSRLILFDKRGSGMSDPVPADELPDLETRMDDIRAVMDEVGSRRAVIYGASESGMLDLLFAATHPERTLALVIHGSYPSARWEPDAPWGWRADEFAERLEEIERMWGTQDFIRREFPSIATDAPLVRWFATYIRRSMSPGAAVTAELMEYETDVRDVLPAIHVPTLILHRVEDDPEANRYMAERISGAEYVALPGSEHIPYLGDQDGVLVEIERFIKGVQTEEASLDRVLATVLFTDIVGSTEKAVELGDGTWRKLVEEHHATVRRLLARYRGTEVDTAGDGFFASFDGPARAIRCAQAIKEAIARLGLDIRAGLHTGECESIGGKIGGIAVVIGSRVGALAGPGEVLVSQTVKDLVAGSGLTFEDAGERELKGIPDRWHLYRVTDR
jgi:class 3 adenylate cyclase/pimeloyl-ACP methyl ester carboxylesterase